MFGLPCSGKTTIIKALAAASKEIIAHVSSGDIARRLSTDKELAHMAEGNLFPFEEPLRAEILKLVHKRRGQGSEVIFIDGFPRFDDQVSWMLDNQLAGSDLEGCLVQVVGENLLDRAKERMRDDQDGLEKIQLKIEEQRKKIDAMEKVIFRHGIPYFTVMNNDPIHATERLSKIVGLRK
jgi:adenylate kinase family enzyme